MNFNNFEAFSVQNKYRGKSKEELVEMGDKLVTDLELASKGDARIIEKELNKIQGAIELIDSTVAGDVAMATSNMFATCTGDDKCECGKCSLLKRKDIQESMIDTSPFGGFFGG